MLLHLNHLHPSMQLFWCVYMVVFDEILKIFISLISFVPIVGKAPGGMLVLFLFWKFQLVHPFLREDHNSMCFTLIQTTYTSIIIIFISFKSRMLALQAMTCFHVANTNIITSRNFFKPCPNKTLQILRICKLHSLKNVVYSYYLLLFTSFTEYEYLTSSTVG